MPRIYGELQALVANGGRLSVDGTKWSFGELQALIATASKKQAMITIRNTDRFTLSELQAFITTGNGFVTLEI